MAEKKTLVTGTYENKAQAEETIADLLAEGFLRDAIAIKKSPEASATAVQLVVHCVTSEQVTSAKDVLKETDAQDISSSTEEPDQVFVES